MRRPRRYTAFALALLAMTCSTLASAEPSTLARAREAYDRGLQAHEQGDPQLAAQEFARADALAPSPTALQAALDAAIEADDAPLGAELLERSRRARPPPGLASSITAAHLKFRGTVGRLRVRCPSGASCAARLDERPIETDAIVHARAGHHDLALQANGEASTTRIEIEADQIVEVTPAKGKPPTATSVAPDTVDTTRPQHDEANDRGSARLPPVVFYVGVGLTMVLASTTAYFAIDASNVHTSFEDAGCTRADFAPCRGLKSDGEDSERAANVGLVLTALTGAATLAVGALFTSWKGPVVALHRGGGEAAWRVTF